jgi:NADH-quinone oxidoreductase E subunit
MKMNEETKQSSPGGRIGRSRKVQTRPVTDPKVRAVMEKFPPERSNLIPLLQALQEKFGWLPQDTLAATADYLRLPASVVYGVATFYAQFYLTRQGKNRIKVCQGTACHVRGGKAIMDTVKKRLGIAPGQTTPDYLYSLERVACLGSCALAPVMVVNNKIHGTMTTVKADQAVQALGKTGAKTSKSAKAKRAVA